MTDALVDLLLRHRQAGTTAADLPADLVPTSLAEAYRVQDAVAKVLGPVGGWKVAPMPETGEPSCGPILRRDIHQDGVTLRRAALPGLAVEVEVAVTINRDLPQRSEPYRAEEMRGAIGSIHVALELLASRYRDRTAVPPLAGAADFQSNGAVVLGSAVSGQSLPEWGEQAMALTLDGEEVARTAGNARTDNVLRALAWLAGHAASRGMPLKTGDVVITGARLGALPFAARTVEAQAPGLGSVSATFTA